jgi:CDP-diacylglycerol--serine O-phosphatidyltransferase
MRWVAFGLTLVAGLLMVSNIRYHSFKGLDLRGKVPFVAILVVVLVYVTITIDPPKVLFFGFLLYALSGPVMTVYLRQRKRRERHSDEADSGTPPADI